MGIRGKMSLPKPYYKDEWVTIYHGDCREILPELTDESIDLVLTDPPYPEDNRFDGSYELIHDVAVKTDRITLDNSWLLSDFGRHYFPSYVTAWNPWNYYDLLIAYASNSMALCFCGFDKFTPTAVFKKGKPKVNGRLTNLVEVVRVVGIFDWPKHPSPKYPKAYSNYIAMLSPAHGIVLDPFLGSGTTAYCAKKLNRKCIGIEIEEKYCEIAAKRCMQGVFNFRV